MAFDGSVKFDTKLDSSGLVKGLKGAAAAGAAALGAISAASIKVGSDFEKAMSNVYAISRANEEEAAKLKDAAIAAGEATQFSASQAADALSYLSLAGYDAEDSVKALPKVLNLAAAGGMDLAYASDLLTDSMAVMGLGIENMDNFSDQLAMAASKSNTSVAQLGEAVLVAGGQAKLCKMSVEKMNTALGILADNGIKGSEGGTALRNTLKNLYTPTQNSAKAKIHDENTLYVVTARAGFDLLLGEKSVDFKSGGVQFHTYKTEDYTFSWFHDSWPMPTEEEYEQLMKDGMIPEKWPFASLEEELEARSKVRLDGFGCGVSGTYADSTMTMKITNSTSERFTITFDPKVKEYNEDARSIGITLPRALEKTDALIIDGAKKKAYIEAESGKKTYVSDVVNWDEWKTLLGTTNVFCDEGEGDITVSVRKASVRESSGIINDWGFMAIYLE